MTSPESTHAGQTEPVPGTSGSAGPVPERTGAAETVSAVEEHVQTQTVAASAPQPSPPPLPPFNASMTANNAPPAAGSRFNIWVWIALAALLLAGWQWWESRGRLNRLQADVAKRLGEATQSVREMQTVTQETRQSWQSATTRLDGLEAMVNESKSQHRALEGLYQEIVRSRDDNTLLEVERALIIAAQQLQLSGNAQAALNALQSADTRLAAVNRPSWLPLRKALNRDIEHLKSLPFVDVNGINLRLENILVLSDKFPLNAESRPTPMAAGAADTANAAADEAAKESGWGWQHWGGRFAKEFWGELKGMVRIQRFDQRDQQALLAPGQDFFLRENFKLRLLNARLALLAHDHTTFHNDLVVAHDWLKRFYDGRDPRVETAKAQLQELIKSPIDFEMPTLGGSFAALKTAEADSNNGAAVSSALHGSAAAATKPSGNNNPAQAKP